MKSMTQQFNALIVRIGLRGILFFQANAPNFWYDSQRLQYSYMSLNIVGQWTHIGVFWLPSYWIKSFHYKFLYDRKLQRSESYHQAYIA